MKRLTNTIFMFIVALEAALGQAVPIDTSTWDIQARSYVIETYKGQEAIYLQGGSMILKDYEFENGTIEFDIFLKEEQAFPGVYFRLSDNGDGEQFYLRPHLPGKADANQAAAAIKNITPWQLYFGPRYSFPYQYKYDDWTTVKILVSENKAQVFLDGRESPNLSWNTFTGLEKGGIMLTGGNRSGMHLANIKISNQDPEIKDFIPIDRETIEGLIQTWELSDKFEESELEELNNYRTLIGERKWQGEISVEEGTAANISRIQSLYDDYPGNTVFARIQIDSEQDQIKLFEFGYSDRVVVILNGNPIYRGTNRWRSRDYRYLGTVGLFDAVYLELEEGNNELLMAVSEDFGGWLVTGRFKEHNGLIIR